MHKWLPNWWPNFGYQIWFCTRLLDVIPFYQGMYVCIVTPAHYQRGRSERKNYNIFSNMADILFRKLVPGFHAS